MSLCYFNCNRCGREDRSSFFHETKCSCGGWYIRSFWTCGLGHKNNPSAKSCSTCKERERTKSSNNFNNNYNNHYTYNRKKNDEAFAFCNCFGEEEKKEEECTIY